MFAGIGNPPGTMDMKAYLLQRFSTIERHQVCEVSTFLMWLHMIS